MALAWVIRTGCTPQELFTQILTRAVELQVAAPLLAATRHAATAPPTDYQRSMGWVLVAWQNALWQLLHAPNLEEGVVDTVRRGGDTDTNAAICGALLGAVYGRGAIPWQWQEAILNCRPAAGDPRVRHPRPARYWPVDAPHLAVQLASSAISGDHEDE